MATMKLEQSFYVLKFARTHSVVTFSPELSNEIQEGPSLRRTLEILSSLSGGCLKQLGVCLPRKTWAVLRLLSAGEMFAAK